MFKQFFVGFGDSVRYRKLKLKLAPHKMTTAQFTSIMFFSNLPVLSLALIKVLVAPASPSPGFWPEFWDAALTQLKAGDIYVYSAAMIAPFWWTLFEYQKTKDRIWWVGVPFWMSLACIVIGSIIYGMSQGSLIKNIPLLNNLAILIYVASAVVLYWSVFFDRKRAPEVSNGHEKEEIEVDSILNKMAKGATK